MFPLLLNPLPILLTLTTSLGVVFHDTQIDRASTTALAVPATFATYGTADSAIKLNDPHVHTERFNVADNMQVMRSSDQPRTQVRGEQDKKYISVKRYVSDGMGSEYHWPSA
jgi:hypothetical protein